jgi:hypothetical protein
MQTKFQETTLAAMPDVRLAPFIEGEQEGAGASA